MYRPRGLLLGQTYQVRMDNRGERFHASGRELQQDGIAVRLEQVLTSELVLVTAATEAA